MYELELGDDMLTKHWAHFQQSLRSIYQYSSVHSAACISMGTVATIAGLMSTGPSARLPWVPCSACQPGPFVPGTGSSIPGK